MLVAHLPVEEAGINHGKGGATSSSLEKGIKSLVRIGANPSTTMLEALSPPQKQHSLPERPEGLEPRLADKGGNPEIWEVKRGSDFDENIVRQGRERGGGWRGVESVGVLTGLGMGMGRDRRREIMILDGGFASDTHTAQRKGRERRGIGAIRPSSLRHGFVLIGTNRQ